MDNTQRMDALVWTGPRQMALQSVPAPLPGSGEVLIAVGAVGICGSELSGYLGKSSLRVPPLIMGHEAAGTIATGNGILADGTQGEPGLRVTFNPLVGCGSCSLCLTGRPNLCSKRQLIGAHRPGAFARYVAVPAKQCWRLPDQLSMSAGALTETLACAVRAVGLAGIGSGDRVLIFGAGPIGLGCLLVARELGASVVVSDLSEGRLAIARSWGAAHVIPAATSDLVSTVKELVPDGIHRSIDAVGAARTRADSLRAVVPGGRAVWIGLHEEESSLPAHILIRNEISVTGSFAYANADFERALELQQRGLFAPAADWLEERPLEAGADAFAELVEGKARAAKILLRVG